MGCFTQVVIDPNDQMDRLLIEYEGLQFSPKGFVDLLDLNCAEPLVELGEVYDRAVEPLCFRAKLKYGGTIELWFAQHPWDGQYGYSQADCNLLVENSLSDLNDSIASHEEAL